MTLLSFIPNRTSARCLNSWLTLSRVTWPPSPPLGARLPPRPLAAAAVPWRLSLFRYGAALMCECCRYPAQAAVVFYSGRNNGVHQQRMTREVACLDPAPHVTKWSGQDLAEARLCARTAADLGCKRLLGRTGTPCGHFTPDAAPPLSLCFHSSKPYSAPRPLLSRTALTCRATVALLSITSTDEHKKVLGSSEPRKGN